MSAVATTTRERTRLPTAIWLAAATTFLATSADNFVLFLLLWLAEPQGWSGLQVALVVLVLRVPTLLTGVLTGRAVDRWGARPVVLADLGTRTALLLLLAASGGSGTLPLLPVLVLGGVSSALAPATYAGVRWLVPRLVPADDYGRANAVVAIGDQLPLLVGTALVGPALVLLGPVGSVLVPAGMLLIAVVLAWRLPTPASPPVTRTASGPARRLPPRVLAIIALSTAYYFVYGPFETASPSYVRSQLGAGEGVYSLLWALFGVGAVATLFLGPMLARRRPGFVNALGALAWGLVMLPVAVIDNTTLAAVLFLVGGAIWGPYTTVETSALQRWVNPARHGAVFGFQRSVLATASPVGAALGALAVAPFGPAAVLAVSALACAGAGGLALASRDLRRAR